MRASKKARPPTFKQVSVPGNVEEARTVSVADSDELIGAAFLVGRSAACAPLLLIS
jgi:hypothetical protein